MRVMGARLRGGVEATCELHTLETAGSNPAPAILTLKLPLSCGSDE